MAFIHAFIQVQEWAKADPAEENVEMDIEKPKNGYGANMNVDTSLPEEQETMLEEPPPSYQQASANPFTAGQASNPFRQ